VRRLRTLPPSPGNGEVRPTADLRRVCFAVSEAAAWVEARLSPDVESPTRASPLGGLGHPGV
jgi:hypothetical protein